MGMVAGVIRPFDLFFWLRRHRFWKCGLRRHTFPMNDGHVWYWRGGKGFPLLALHGLGGRVLQDYSSLLPRLAPRHHIIAPDFPGFGFSHPISFDQSINAQAVVLRKLLDHARIERTDLLGNSMGGWIALRFAHLFPDRVNRIVLTAPAGISFNPPPLNVFTPSDEAEMAYLIESLFHEPPRLPRWVVRDWLRVSLSRRQTVSKMLESMLSGIDIMDAHLPQIQAPTLILWGTRDRLLPIDMGRRLVKQMPRAQLHEIEDCGHILIHERAELTLTKIEEWLIEK